MELIKKNIHMNKLKCQSNVQLTLDDDFNVPDIKPDIDKIIKEQGEIHINDIKVSNGKLMITGNLIFNILYISTGDSRPVHNINGEIPFDEVINMDAACADDNVSVRWELEDLNTSLINCRKISVKSLVGFQCMAEELYDEETATDVEGDSDVQYTNKSLDVTQIAVNKKDTFRIKDEVMLPSNKSNIFEILYSESELRNTDIRLGDDKITIKGEVVLFLLYAGESQEHQFEWVETEIPFNGAIDCIGSKEEMIGDIDMGIQSKMINAKPDADGEERIFDVEIILDLNMKLYEEQQIDIINDMYSVSKDLDLTMQDACYESLLVKNNSKARVSDRIKLGNNQPAILQICNCCGNIKVDDTQIVEGGIDVNGVIEVHILYVTEEDSKPLYSVKGILPFQQFLEAKGIDTNCVYSIKPCLDQLSVIMLDSNEIEVKAVLNLNTIVFLRITEPIISDVEETPIPMEKVQMMPGVIGYVVKPGDSLWKIAKKYHTTVDMLKEMNGLEHDMIKPGDKLLILKKIDHLI